MAVSECHTIDVTLLFSLQKRRFIGTRTNSRRSSPPTTKRSPSLGIANSVQQSHSSAITATPLL
jgi:hypothetical protein